MPIFDRVLPGVRAARVARPVVYRHRLPASTNAPIAIAGNSVLVPAGGPSVFGAGGGSPQLVAYTVP